MVLDRHILVTMTDENNAGNEAPITNQNVDSTSSAAVVEVGAGGAIQPNASLASLAHWSFLVALVVPFAQLIIPLVLMNIQVGKDDKFVFENAKEALNLFIASFIAILCCLPLILIFFLGIFLLIAIAICLIIFPIVAACQTMGSTMDTPVYRYPLIFRLIK